MINPSQRPLPDNTQHSQQTNIHASGGIRTNNLSRREAEDLRFRPPAPAHTNISRFIRMSRLVSPAKSCLPTYKWRASNSIFHPSPNSIHIIQSFSVLRATASVFSNSSYLSKGKGLPQEAKVAQGVPGRLRPRIFLTFGTTRVVGRQLYAPAAFIPGEIPGNRFYRLSRQQGTWFCRQLRKKIPSDTTGNRSRDRPT